MNYKYILFFIILLTACRQKREVKPSFYYWKTVYKQNKVEEGYIKSLKCEKLYLRIMDVDIDETNKAIPIAPISFKNSIPFQIQVIPVVFIVNDALKNQSNAQIEQLAYNILAFVKQKVLQSGKTDYEELQIDCDWTQSTRETYFSLLKLIKKFNHTRLLSCTLRLHQLKNQKTSGIPPVDKVLLMCYNMGNLRKFGTQNSILDVTELKKYIGSNLSDYKLPTDVALPLFSWAVVFDGRNYAGISKRLKLKDLKDDTHFAFTDGLYFAKADLPDFGIKRGNTVRYEDSKPAALEQMGEYLSQYLSEKPINIIYYHLDEEIFKTFSSHELEKITAILR